MGKNPWSYKIDYDAAIREDEAVAAHNKKVRAEYKERVKVVEDVLAFQVGASVMCHAIATEIVHKLFGPLDLK